MSNPFPPDHELGTITLVLCGCVVVGAVVGGRVVVLRPTRFNEVFGERFGERLCKLGLI